MAKLKWNRVKVIHVGAPHDPNDDWFSARYDKTFPLHYKRYGKTWGASKLEAGIYWRFSVHPLKTPFKEGSKGYNWQLLISGIQGMNGHVYVETLTEGKKIAQEICDYFIKKFQSIK